MKLYPIISLYEMSSEKTLICPLCRDTVDKLVYRFHLENEQHVIDRIKVQYPEWSLEDGLCGRCVDYYHSEIIIRQQMLPEVGPYFPIKSADDFIILPTPLRVGAHPRYTGKGITICFIDSGFYPHPDLTRFRNRIKLILDITNNNKQLPNHCEEDHSTLMKAELHTGYDTSAWHGTMTSVVCAGDGFLSNGLYRGIACDAELVLLKVQDAGGKITSSNIANALSWVLEHHQEYGIRIVNISLGDEEALSHKESEVDQLAERLIEEGIVVVAAAGNDTNAVIKPPANAPNVIAVGGADDNNNLEGPLSRLYQSSFGKTIDGFMKPELVAHAIWIAAPILPGTKEQAEAAYLIHLLNSLPEPANMHGNEEIQIESNSRINGVPHSRQEIIQLIQERKYISAHYMHVDGTSFAAPMVSAVIAQLLEANPSLSPKMVRNILFTTAKRIKDIPAERQGFGIISPRKALLKVLKQEIILKEQASPYINKAKKAIEFYIMHSSASQVALSGSFNDWARDLWLMQPEKNGIWKIEIPMLPAGKYSYKYYVDDESWQEDVDNPLREPDGFNGFNSLLIIEN